MLKVKNLQILQNKHFSRGELLLDKQHSEMLPNFKDQRKESFHEIPRKLSHFFHQPLPSIVNNAYVSGPRDFGFITIPVEVAVMQIRTASLKSLITILGTLLINSATLPHFSTWEKTPPIRQTLNFYASVIVWFGGS